MISRMSVQRCFNVFILLAPIFLSAQNLLVNGDFESGGNNVGFNINGSGYTEITAPFSGNTVPGNFAFTTNPQPMNTANFISCGDHTSNLGKMMVIDGNSTGGNQRFWRAGNNGTGVTGLTVGSTYTLTYYIRSISNTVTDAATQANIGVQFTNTSSSALVFGSAMAPLPIVGWARVSYNFVPTNANVFIELWNTNTSLVGNDFAVDDFSVTLTPTCPVPVASVTQQPTCAISTGTIVVSSPITPVAPLQPNLFISEVTDENVGALTYIEIYNGTGAAVNMANYSIKVYNNGNAFTSCNFTLTGTLNNNSVYVVSIGSATNQGGVIPNFTNSTCAGINDNDNIRLATSGGVDIDNWGRTDGVAYTPAPSGYTYRRLPSAPHPSMTWNPADWTTVVPQNYTNVGSYSLALPQYEYSIDGVNYQSSTTFNGLAPGNYNVTVRDLTSGCVSSPIALTVNPVPIPPTATPFLFCDVPDPTITGPHATFDFNNAGQTSFTVTYTVNGVPYGPYNFTAPSHFSAVTGVVPGDPVVLTLTWNGLCTPSQTISCYPTCITPVNPTFTQVPAICSGQPLAALPTTSNNNVIGVWSPAINNTTTTTYTFTPNPGECGNNAQMTITVNPNVAPTFTAVAPICSGDPLLALPTTSTNGITGTWSPAINNTATTTYTFTPNSGQCASATLTQMTIPVNPIVTPTFNAVAPICSGATLAPLPTTSTNGITGTWSPALNNTTTTTYTFTPTAGQCTSATLTQLTITVNPNVTPTFNAVAPICSGNPLSPLPTTSTNGVTGTWSPALNNTATTTYTFTPTAGLCSPTQTLTITVNPRPTPTFTPVAPICSGGALTPLPTTSNNGISGTWSPALNNMATTTYTFTPSSGVCATIATLQIVVTPQTNPTVNVQSQCNSSIVTVTSPTGADFQYSVDGGPYQASPVFSSLAVGPHNLIANQISTNCLSTVTNFSVAPSTNDVIANNPPPLQYCDPNNDGLGVFDLTQVINAVTGGAPYTVTFHETFTDADIDGTAIPNPTNYPSINSNQIIYIRVESTITSCYQIVQLQLIVNPTPVAVDPLSDYHECDNDYDGYTVFNLSTYDAQVLGSLNPATHQVTYHTSLNDAQLGLGAIGNPSNYTNTTADAQTIWVRVEIIATGCYDIVELDLIVDPLPQSMQPAYPPYSLCDNTAPAGFEQFDLDSQVPSILNGQSGISVTFYPSLTLAQGGNPANAIPPGLYTNTSPFVQTLGVVLTNDTTGCFVISTMDIRVDPLPTPIPPTQANIVCDTDQNGFSQFDLCSMAAAMSPPGTGYLITFHETQSDAQQGNNDLPCFYTNINPFTQTIWVRAEDPVTHCVSVMPIVLQADPSPVLVSPLADITVCDADANNQNAVTFVDLTVQTPGILAAQSPPASNYTVSYYTTQTGAEAGTNPIITPAAYQAFNGQVIWVRVENNTTHCYNVGSFNVIINIPLLLTNPTPLSVCDNDANPNDQHTAFDLTVKDNQITGGLPGYTVTYYPSYADAQAGTNPINNTAPLFADPTAYVNVPPAVQTLGVQVTSAAGCSSYTTLDIRVLPVPTPNTTPPALTVQCEDALNSGQQVFDVTVNAAYIANADPNVTLHYFHTLADATSVPPMNEITTPAAALIGDPALLNTNPRPVGLVQNIYIAVTSNQFTDFNGQNCYTIVEQPFTINPLPVAVAIGPQQICEEDQTANDGFEVFDLTSYNPLILAGNATTPVSTYTVTFYTDAAHTNQITNPTAYTNTSNPQVIYVVVTNDQTGCTNSTAFDIMVNPKPDLTPPPTFATCDDEVADNDGYYLYPLDVLIPGILNGQSPSDFTVSFYHSQAEADAGTPAITDLPNYQAQTQTIWIRVEDNLTHCYKLGSFDIIIEQYATPVIQTTNDVHTICVDYITGDVIRPLELFAVNTTQYLNAGVVTPPNYTYQWYQDGVLIPGAIFPSYIVNTPLASSDTSIFTVEMTSTSALGCSATSPDFIVNQSGPAVAATGTVGYTVTGAFSENQIITVMVQGYGTYQYSLDDGPRQDSPVFENVPLGSHVITVWDTEGGLDYSCDALMIQQVSVINYPHYFTPNGDGIHDNWNIVGLEGQPSSKIYIFDRFGKLLKQISSTGEGWDGTYNGQQLPSTDYWFTVDYTEDNTTKQFKAHFTLKR